MTRDASRQLAQERLGDLLALLQALPTPDAHDLIVDGEGLRRAIDAFHLEGIRFRMFKMDRMLHRVTGLPVEVSQIFAEIRTALEAAGVHTRSH
jgi:hypothetical protein